MFKCAVCRKSPCETKVYCRACMITSYLLDAGPEGQPTMTPAQMEEFLRLHGSEIEGLVQVEDSTGMKFLAVNHGVSNDGKGVEITVLAQIV